MNGISKRFPNGTLANADISLEVQPGEIHGVLGENGAGKSTLMKILYGLLQADEGHIEIDGTPAIVRSPREAAAHGIGMVHQHFMLVPGMTVTENVILGLRAGPLPFARLRLAASKIAELSGRYSLDIDPGALVRELSVGAQQRVEILKLLYRDLSLLIFDEPTAVLTPQEWQQLAAILRRLAADDKAIIFITHKLDEMLDVADNCTVLRHGAVVGRLEIASASKEELARLMVGRDVVMRVERKRTVPGDVLLSVRDLSVLDSHGRPVVDSLSFQIRAGEVLGVAGVDGNGQEELVDALTGMRPVSDGVVTAAGQVVPELTPTTFATFGAVIPADRRKNALALELSVGLNLMMRDFHRKPYSRAGVLSFGLLGQRSEELANRFDIRAPSLGIGIGKLSGGNQQKAVLARELSRAPRLLIAAQPTRGLDVGATEYVYDQIQAFKLNGGAVLLISTELSEVLSLSDRVAVMSRGRFLAVLDPDQADVGQVGLLMAGEAATT
jgi:general nucleoside transport system ATP-binding protein